MTEPKDSNKAGDTKTTSKEYVKRESGEQNVPAVPAENTGDTSPNQDDLEHPEQEANREHPKDKAVADKVKETNDKHP